MGNKDRHCQKVSSFNPAWCLRPPVLKAATPRSGNIGSGIKSPVPSNYRPKKSRHHHHHSPDFAAEPTSPRVGCMGQIRRCKAPSGRAAGSGHSYAATPSRSSSVSPQCNLLMLKRGAGGSVNTSSSSSTSLSLSASPVSVITGEFSLLMLKRVSSTRVTFEEMDPPRPVERKAEAVKPENSVSLWKRRCGGGGGLQLKLQTVEQMSLMWRRGWASAEAANSGADEFLRDDM